MILEATQIGQTSKEAAADTFTLLKPLSAEAGVAAGHTLAQLCKCHSPSSRHQALQYNRNQDQTSGIGYPRYTEEEKIWFKKPEERQNGWKGRARLYSASAIRDLLLCDKKNFQQ